MRTSRGLAGRGDGHLVLSPVPSPSAAERVEREHISCEGLQARRVGCGEAPGILDPPRAEQNPQEAQTSVAQGVRPRHGCVYPYSPLQTQEYLHPSTLNAFQEEKACPKIREGSSQTPLKRAPWLEMLLPQPVPTGTPPNHTSEAFGVLGNTRGGVCFTAHVSGSPEQRLEQMQSIEHIPSPGCITARGSAGTSAPASPAPSTHLASSAISSGGARGESPPTSSWEQGAFPHGANISGTTGNVQLDYNALRKGHGGISALYLELCSFRAGRDGKSQLALARGIRTAPTASRGAGGAQKPPQPCGAWRQGTTDVRVGTRRTMPKLSPFSPQSCLTRS